MQTLTYPAPPVKSTRFEPSPEDRAWAAECFGSLEEARLREEENRHYDELAAEAEWLDRFNDSIRTGRCVMCGEPSDDLDRHALCDSCSDRATNATIACQNKSAMGQSRVF
jgi:hypothetical protein